MTVVHVVASMPSDNAYNRADLTDQSHGQLVFLLFVL